MTMHPRLRARLEPLARRRRSLRLWLRLAGCWTVAAGFGLGLMGLEALVGWSSWLALPVVALLGLALCVMVIVRAASTQTNWRALAREVEARHPELDGRLLTAVQLEPVAARAVPGKDPGPRAEFDYLPQRVLDEAVAHHDRADWGALWPRSRLAAAHLAHLGALVCLAVVLWGLRVPGSRGLLVPRAELGVTVTPGDVELERGSSLVVMAQFHGRVPGKVDLVVSGPAEAERRIPLVRSLADPLFGATIPEVTSNLVYRLEYARERTRAFQVTVFEYPRLERADADITFPGYTGQAPKHLDNTRRLSAVEGSRLDLLLHLNKTVATATLVGAGREATHPREALALAVETERPAARLEGFRLERNATYDLQLVDAEGRTNRVPAQFVFAALKNRTPELKLASPRGDSRPSALEEMVFEGTVWDDFGTSAYGLAWSVPGQDLNVIELGRDVPSKEKRSFQYLLRLEELGLAPDDLLSWFVWADDIGPDGTPRRTTGDLFFAEVRPFEAVFRQGPAQSGGEQEQQQQGAGGGGPAEQLAELQKQIISATWKLFRQTGADVVPKGSSGSREDRKDGTRRESAPSPRSSDASKAGLPLARAERVLEEPPVFRDQARVEDLPSARHPSVPPHTPIFINTPLQRGVNETPEAEGARKLLLAVSGGPRASEPGRPPPRLSPRGDSSGWHSAGFAAPVLGQPAPSGAERPARWPGRSSPADPRTNSPALADDLGVVTEAQAQALEQAELARERQENPQGAALWEAAIQQMERARERLRDSANSPEALREALAAEQAAYQALLKLQEREYSVSRNRNRQNRQGARQQQLQRELDQLDLTEEENRYETERQARAPQSAERREQLQVMNRLRELARRQQDVNERLQELQTALQAARTEPEREEIRRQLKRLAEEEQRLLADADELRQRLDRPENQPTMTEPRRQLDQAREELQRAAEATRQEEPSRALAAGTRAQQRLEQMRDDLRRQSASEFAEDLRQMRAEARELARQQEAVRKELEALNDSRRRTLSDSDVNQRALEKLAAQNQRLTNLVQTASQLSQQAEEAEPRMSRELYDTLRKFTQDDNTTLKQFQEDLMNRGLTSRELYQRLKRMADQSGAKALELTSEMLRQGLLPEAATAEERARAGIGDLKRGVERAAESVLGDDAESLRLAREELERLAGELQREIARAAAAETGASEPEAGTNQPGPIAQADPQAEDLAQAGGDTRASEQPQQAAPGEERPPGSRQPGAPGENRGQAQRAGDRNPNDQPDRSMARDASDPRTPQPGRAPGGERFTREVERLFDGRGGSSWGGPITGSDFAPWSDGLRNVEELVETPSLRNDVARARERARQMRQDYRLNQKKPDWAVVRLQVLQPLVEVRDAITEELARREPRDQLVPIDRDPVPGRYSELVRRYYEQLGKDNPAREHRAAPED